MNDDKRLSTLLGVVAILLWSSHIGISRSLAESVGAVTSAGLSFLVGGAIACADAGLRKHRLSAMLRLPRAYLLGAGALFASYMFCLVLAIGLAVDRQQTLEVGVLNYLWPSVTLALAVPILGTRVGPLFPVGILLALAGAALAPIPVHAWSPDALLLNLRAHPLPYALATAAAVLWGLYSTLARRWAPDDKGGAVPLFSLATGMALLLLRPWFPEPAAWSPRVVLELTYMSLFPGVLAYAMWDRAVRRGNLTLVASASYAAPVLSTLVSWLYLDVPVAWNVWVACVLTSAGAIVASRAVRAQKGTGSSSDSSSKVVP